MKKFFLAAALAAGLAVTGSAATLRFDFGAADQLAAGNYNHVFAAQDPVLNAIDVTGAATGIGLTTAGFNEVGPNFNGTTAPTAPADIFDPGATRDSLFGHSDNFNAGAPRPSATLTFSGLDGSGGTTYDFTFFASRTGATDNRETQYSVAGATSGVGYLNAAGNIGNVATVSGITPTAGGEVAITIAAGPNNNNGSHFYYLGALQVVSAAIPEPSTLGLASLAGMLALALRRRS